MKTIEIIKLSLRALTLQKKDRTACSEQSEGIFFAARNDNSYCKIAQPVPSKAKESSSLLEVTH